ncbi:hypothetical protein F5Y13DRAFT_25119 [Hypoxylon sp. FL1857]|nr:hypothetical protein F5Y13DRAFT_25119 [Hypoxylon sp. FL1857]
MPSNGAHHNARNSSLRNPVEARRDLPRRSIASGVLMPDGVFEQFDNIGDYRSNSQLQPPLLMTFHEAVVSSRLGQSNDLNGIQESIATYTRPLPSSPIAQRCAFTPSIPTPSLHDTAVPGLEEEPDNEVELLESSVASDNSHNMSPSRAPESGDDSKDPDSLSLSDWSYSFMDSDCLSLSDTSDDIEGLRLDEQVDLELTDLVRDLVVQYTGAASGESSSTGNKTSPTTSSGSSHADSLSPGLRKKRGRAQENSDGSGDDESHLPPLRKAKQDGMGSHRSLACPFAKNDPRKHHACFSKKLSRIRDVKQHLARKHTPSFYCNRCSAIFSDHESLQAHIGDAAGLFCNVSPLRDSISQQQRLQLSRKSDPKLLEEGQWFSIWDIIFPGRERPKSAYVDFGLSEDLCSYREYSHDRVINAVIEELRSSGLTRTPEEPQRTWEEIRRIVADRLDSIFEEWQSTQPLNSASLLGITSNHRSSQTQPRRQDTTAGSEESRVSLGNNAMANESQSPCRLPADMGGMLAQSANEEQSTETGAFQNPCLRSQNIQQDVPDSMGDFDFDAFWNGSIGRSDTTAVLDRDIPADSHIDPYTL